MDNSVAKLEKSEFDWDKIDVGDFNLDHSENFFAAANKENIPKIKEDFSDNNISNGSQNILPLNWDTAPHAQVKLELKSRDDSTTMDVLPKEEQIELKYIKKECNDMKVDAENCATNVQAPANLRLEWSFAAPAQQAVNGNWHNNGTDNDASAPKAYAFKDVYQQKREEALRKRAEEERKARQFHSRPMPNFKAHHKRLQETFVIHKITVPTTPETVKHWMESVERRKLMERRENQIQQKQTSNKGMPGGRRIQLHDAPEADSMPFQLHTEQRMRERREYDATVQCNLEQKKKEQEEQRIKREMEEFKEIRKMTEFKARPNPFK